ncbi:MAG TPA: histidine kinase N-terminal 7TM domain-containing protein [Anaerolineaceae bacterium]
MDSFLILSPFILIAIASLALGVEAWRRAHTPGSLIFTALMVAVTIWLVTSVGEGAATTPGGKILWAKIAYLGISWVATLWFIFILEYIYPGEPILARFGGWFGVMPAVTIALVMTNDLHGLVWSSVTPLAGQRSLTLVYHHGLWFWIYAVYSYAVLAIGAVELLRSLRAAQRKQRMNIAGLLAGMAIPWAANIAYLAGFTFPPGQDPTPYGFAITGLVYAWLLRRWGLFDISPLAHKAILENISEGYIIVDPRGRVVEINELACRFLSLARESVVGKNASAVLAAWPDLAALLQPGERPPVEFQAPGSPELYIEASRNQWMQARQKAGGIILLLYDITRRRQAEENLVTSERTYRHLVNNAPVGITLTDTSGNITFVSPIIYDLYHMPESESIVGKSPLQWIHPEDRPLAAARLREAIRSKEALPPHEYRLVRPDGSIFWGEITSSPILDEQGNASSLLTTIRDVTQRKLVDIYLQENLERQTFTNNLLQILYRPQNLTAALGQVLEHCGDYTGANRVYLCRDSADESETTIAAEWCSPTISPRARENPLVRYAAIPSWVQEMNERGQVLVEDSAAASADIAEFMNAWDIRSLAAFQIYGSEKRVFGFLAFDHCEQNRHWTGDDLALMTVVCRIVSGAVTQIQVEEAEYRQRTLAEALHDTASALNSTLNLEEVLDRILSNLEKVVQNVSASIALVDEEGMVRMVRWRGYSDDSVEMMRKLTVRMTDVSSYRQMVMTGRPVIIQDTWTEKSWVVYQPNSWIRSYMGVPISIKGKVEGFINLDSAEPEFFNDELSYSLHVFAEQAAVAIENARLYDEAHRRAEELSILNRIGLTLTAGLEMNQVLFSLFDECRKVLPIDVFYVALYDSGTERIDLPLYFSEGEMKELESRDLRTESGLTNEVIRQRQTIYLPDTLDEETERLYHIVRLGGPPARSYVGVPLILLDQVVGVISMQNLSPYAYTTEQIRLLETISTQAAIAVWNARLYDQMKQMAITDSVTGLFTRRHFTSLGRSEVERALRYDRRLSVFMVDIDHFKRVNDSYGHNIGDQVLKTVAQTCRQALRQTDIIGRWGGEEFAIVLPEADRDGAAMIAERIRRMMADKSITVGQVKLGVTVSIGVAILEGGASSLEILIDSADRAMYQAKQRGRNQVQVSARQE